MAENEHPPTEGAGYLVEGDPAETAEQERERLGQGSPQRDRAASRGGGTGPGQGENDEPAAGEGLNRGGYAPRR